MKSTSFAVRLLVASFIQAPVGVPAGCGPGETDVAPAPVNQDANKK
jgi:hypothetical protein